MKKIIALVLAFAMCLALAAPAAAASKPYINPADRDGVWDRSHHYVTTKPLCVRGTASNSGKIVAFMPAGTEVVDLYRKANASWLCVQCGKGVAYVGRQYCAEDTAAAYENVLVREDGLTFNNSKATDKAGMVNAAEVVTVTGGTVWAGKTAMIPVKVGKKHVFIPGVNLCWTDVEIIKKKAKKVADLLEAPKKGKPAGTVRKGASVVIVGSSGKYYQIPKRVKGKLKFRYVLKSAF